MLRDEMSRARMQRARQERAQKQVEQWLQRAAAELRQGVVEG